MATQAASTWQGLTTEQAKDLQLEYGYNELAPVQKKSFFKKILKTIKEPMFILLIVTAIIYFILGEPRDGAIMLVFVIFVIGIEVVQEWKTDRTLEALKDLSSPLVSVIRDGKEQLINSRQVVPGDFLIIKEGEKIAADGVILRLSDLCVDESTMTGEAEKVWKEVANQGIYSGLWRKDTCYAGTMVMQGSGIIKVTHIGSATEYGKIGKAIAEAPDRPTPLEKQTARLVKFSTVFAVVLCFVVFLITFSNLAMYVIEERFTVSILAGITLAMGMIPEEFPVILTIFLSMGAWRLAKNNSLVARLSSVETLGEISVLCVDKTGTLTQNKMAVNQVWQPSGKKEEELAYIMGKACEIEVYDPMEKAMLEYCHSKGVTQKQLCSGELLLEYPLTSETKMMGHVWQDAEGRLLLAAKGSPEGILSICNLTEAAKEEALGKQIEMAKNGYRVIAVASCKLEKEAKRCLEENLLNLVGLVGLADPPREAVPDAIKTCQKAGIRVIMITGDNGLTATSIANQIGINYAGEVLTGDDIDAMSAEELAERVKAANIFARVAPTHKLKIVQALKANGEVVAMTGDGVNDAPALKYADIGIAMGKRGSSVAREAADLVLMDDNFTTIVNTVADARRIYDNIRKTVGYIFSIHTPIALAALFAPLLGIDPLAVMLLPLHIVVLELVIDPTCSIVFERQPAEPDIMCRKPRGQKESLINKKIVFEAFLQGVVMFVFTFGSYYYLLNVAGKSPELARTFGLACLIFGNLWFVQVASSRQRMLYKTMGILWKDKIILIANVVIILGLLFLIYTPAAQVLQLAPLSFSQLIICFLLSAASVLWYEIIKYIRIKKRTIQAQD